MEKSKPSHIGMIINKKADAKVSSDNYPLPRAVRYRSGAQSTSSSSVRRYTEISKKYECAEELLVG